jgi:hypothetical protein
LLIGGPAYGQKDAIRIRTKIGLKRVNRKPHWNSIVEALLRIAQLVEQLTVILKSPSFAGGYSSPKITVASSDPRAIDRSQFAEN